MKLVSSVTADQEMFSFENEQSRTREYNFPYFWGKYLFFCINFQGILISYQVIWLFDVFNVFNKSFTVYQWNILWKQRFIIFYSIIKSLTLLQYQTTQPISFAKQSENNCLENLIDIPPTFDWIPMLAENSNLPEQEHVKNTNKGIDSQNPNKNKPCKTWIAWQNLKDINWTLGG